MPIKSWATVKGRIPLKGVDGSYPWGCSDLLWSVGSILFLREMLLKLSMCEKGNQQSEESGNYVRKEEVDRTGIVNLASGRLGGLLRLFANIGKPVIWQRLGTSCEFQRANADGVR